MPYAVENALYEWQEGERRLSAASETARADLERVVEIIHEELRRRLGSSFSLDELADHYSAGTDWASELAGRHAAGSDAAAVVDAAFLRYARESSNYAGGRTRARNDRP